MREEEIYRGIDPHILGQTLQNIRKTQTVWTQQQVADMLGIARTTLVAVENGTRFPRPEELAHLAQIYNRSVHDLLNQKISPESLALQLRAAKRVDERTERELQAKHDEFQELCEDYVRLEQIRGCPMPPSQAPVYMARLEGVSAERLGETAALAERNRLGLGDAPILNLEEVLEHEGIRIFQLPLPSRVCGFFGYTGELGPCIALNVKHPPERRRWTLAHEYAHFLGNRHEADVSVYYAFKQIPEHERFADVFARAFLLPESSVIRHFNDYRKSRGNFLPADLCRLAHLFFISIEAMSVRLEGLRLIRPGTYDRLVESGFHPSEANMQLGLKPRVMSQDLLPLRYQYLATEARELKQITWEAYAKFMRIDLVHARKKAQDLQTESIMTAGGISAQKGFPLTEEVGA